MTAYDVMFVAVMVAAGFVTLVAGAVFILAVTEEGFGQSPLPGDVPGHDRDACWQPAPVPHRATRSPHGEAGTSTRT